VILDALGVLDVRAVATTGRPLAGRAVRAPANVGVTEFVPHALVLGETDLMITHAGLGSVAAALSFGVPLVCTPLGRDQPLNAERVAKLGAGVALDGEPEPDDIARAVEHVLSDPSYAKAARAIAEEGAAEGGPAAAAAELESLAGD
jgi:MGT family glycosyltransferase